MAVPCGIRTVHLVRWSLRKGGGRCDERISLFGRSDARRHLSLRGRLKDHLRTKIERRRLTFFTTWSSLARSWTATSHGIQAGVLRHAVRLPAGIPRAFRLRRSREDRRRARRSGSRQNDRSVEGVAHSAGVLVRGLSRGWSAPGAIGRPWSPATRRPPGGEGRHGFIRIDTVGQGDLQWQKVRIWQGVEDVTKIRVHRYRVGDL